MCSGLRRTRAGRVRRASKLIHPRHQICQQRCLASNLLAPAQRAARVDGEGKLYNTRTAQNGAQASAAVLERSVSKLRRGCEAAHDELHKARRASAAPRCSSEVAPSHGAPSHGAPSQVTPSQVTPRQVSSKQVTPRPSHPQAKSRVSLRGHGVGWRWCSTALGGTITRRPPSGCRFWRRGGAPPYPTRPTRPRARASGEGESSPSSTSASASVSDPDAAWGKDETAMETRERLGLGRWGE